MDWFLYDRDSVMKELNNAARCETFCWIIWTVYMVFIAVNPKCELMLFPLRSNFSYGHFTDTMTLKKKCLFQSYISRRNNLQRLSNIQVGTVTHANDEENPAGFHAVIQNSRRHICKFC